MSTQSETLQKVGQVAFQNRLWWHSLGLVNGQRIVGILPDGRRGDEEPVGTATALKWGEHYVILTAKHVVENARPNDLRFFCRPTGAIEFKSQEEILKQGYVEVSSAHPIAAFDIVRCQWDDLALITTVPMAGLNVEFHNVAAESTEPAEGLRLYCLGFPTCDSFDVHVERIGDKEIRTRAINPIF